MISYPALETAVREIEEGLPTTIDPDDVALWFETQQLISDAAKRLSAAAGLLGGVLAESVPRGKGATVVSDGRIFKRTGTPTRKGWKNDELLRVVLDSRLFEPGTGALVDETPVEKILAVWNLGSPRTTALKARGIDADDFCTVEWSNRGIAEVGV